jgi:hypothetical protein
MRPTTRLAATAMILVQACLGTARAASPAPTSYSAVERAIGSIRQTMTTPGGQPNPFTPGWNALFDAVLDDLKVYSKAQTEDERLAALSRLDQIAVALQSVQWPPAGQLRAELTQWLEPRLRLASACRTLNTTIDSLPPTADAAIKANRARWVEFARHDLGNALRDYDAAATVTQRQDALRRIHDLLSALGEQSQSHPWAPSIELLSAVNDLFNRPNIDVSADVATVAPLFDKNLVETGPVTRKGYVSQVTAGPKTGFGLLASDNGIAFFNRQLYSSVTPIWDFQNQIAADQQGQRAAKMYQFFATSTDQAELTITTVVRSSGLDLAPSWSHAIDASICSQPTAGGEFGRMIAGLIGMNQQAITNRVYEGAIGRFRQQIPVESREEGLERIAVELDRRNAELRSNYLVGNNTIAVRDFLLTQVELKSHPEAAFVAGLLQWRGAPGQHGADLPQPPTLATTFEPGITADVHLGSMLSSLIAGAYEREPVKSTQNVMLTIKQVPPNTPPRDGISVAKNVDFATYVRAVDEIRKAGDKNSTVLRINRPQKPPEFSADARGFLVALIRDLQIDVPAPENEAKGGALGAPAKIYRLKVPQLEIAISYKVVSPTPNALRFQGKVEEFNPGTNAEVIAIADDETKGSPLSRFPAGIVLGAMGARLRTQPIDVPLDQLPLRGIAIRSVSPLDPSGWVRVGLARDDSNPSAVAVVR